MFITGKNISKRSCGKGTHFSSLHYFI